MFSWCVGVPLDTIKILSSPFNSDRKLWDNGLDHTRWRQQARSTRWGIWSDGHQRVYTKKYQWRVYCQASVKSLSFFLLETCKVLTVATTQLQLRNVPKSGDFLARREKPLNWAGSISAFHPEGMTEPSQWTSFLSFNKSYSEVLGQRVKTKS